MGFTNTTPAMYISASVLWMLVAILGNMKCFAQTTSSLSDSIVRFSEIVYNSKLEEEALKNYFLQNENNYVDIFLSVTPGIDKLKAETVTGRISQSVSAVNNAPEAKKGIEKKAQFIFKHVHDNYLKKYELDNRFNHIFETGAYNCVSASALYAVMFEALGMPYAIKETPTHVYLVAYPSTYAIRVETTDPVFGYYQFSEQYKSKYITNLKQQKLISEEEFNAANTEELFNRYYFNDTTITLSQLVALQYVNDALFKMEKKEFKEAYRQLEKAYLFYPSPRVSYTLIFAAANVLAENEFNDVSNADYLVKLSRFLSNSEYSHIVSRDELSNEFARFTDKMLLENYRPALYDSVYHKLKTGIKDSTLLQEISFLYNFHYGQALIMQMQTSKSLQYLEKAYSLKPNHLQAQTFLVGAIANKIDNLGSIEAIISAITRYKNDFPDLSGNDMFNSLTMNMYIAAGGYYFSEGKQLIAEEYLDKFEKMFAEKAGVLINEELVGNSYSEAASYYFKKGNYPKTKSVLRKGLEYAPDNYKLKKRLEMMN